MPYALITGGSKGIGKALAIQLANRKFDLLLIARNEQELEKTSLEIKATFSVDVKYLPLDLSHPEAAKEILEWCKRNDITIQILVNNAGYGLAGPFEHYRLSQHLDMLQVNVLSLVSLTHLFLPELKKHAQSYILNISSSAAYQATPGLGLYAASKAFVLSFTRSLAIELTHTPVSVTCVCPGGTETDFPIRAQVGEKALKLAKKVNMQPQTVAAIAVKAMFNKRTEVVTGGINKLGVFLAWLLPKKIVEKSAANIYGINKALG